MSEALAAAEVLYSDHDHQLILVVDDVERARAIARAWETDGT